MVQSVAAYVDDGCEGGFDSKVCWGDAREPVGGGLDVSHTPLLQGRGQWELERAEDLHPRDFLIVCELEDEFVDDTIDTHRSADELQLGVSGVAEDEAVGIELGEGVATDAAR